MGRSKLTRVRLTVEATGNEDRQVFSWNEDGGFVLRVRGRKEEKVRCLEPLTVLANRD